MKYIYSLFLACIIITSAHGQVTPPDYAGNPSYWVYGNNPTPIANITPIPLITAVATPTGTPASQRYYITDVAVSNQAAAVDTDVQLLDGSTVKWNCPAARQGGGCTQTFRTPLRGSPNTTWSCKAVGTGASVTCSVAGYKAPN